MAKAVKKAVRKKKIVLYVAISPTQSPLFLLHTQSRRYLLLKLNHSCKDWNATANRNKSLSKTKSECRCSLYIRIKEKNKITSSITKKACHIRF